VWSSFLGTAIEYYDFTVYGTLAALVFAQLFFPGADPFVGTLSSFATLAVGFLARPLGSIVFGWFGDRLGRQKTLMFAMMLMGVATVAIGLLPTYATMGVFAPILLTLLRFIQGIAIGGEWAGAALMLVEGAQPKQKNFVGSFVQAGGPGGLLLAIGAVSASVAISGPEFLTWGWRLPFLASVVLVGTSLYIRHRVEENPQVAAILAKPENVSKAPVGEVLRRHWRVILLGAGIASVGNAVVYVVVTYTLSLATTTYGYERQDVLNTLLFASGLYLFGIPFFGWVADRIGVLPVLVIGTITSAGFAFAYFALLESGSFLLIFLSMAFWLVITHSALQAPQPALFASKFPVRVRYTGTALTQALPTTLIGGTLPFLAALLFAWGGTAAISWYIIILAVVATLCAIALTRMQVETEDTHEEVAEAESQFAG
jgi:MFS family permease